jgi:hypothetical protein
MQTFVRWDVPREFAEVMYNYLVYGYAPGGCFTSVLANDFAGAIQRSHSSNTIEAFKALVGWMREIMPLEAYSSYEKVDMWINLIPEQRRVILEKDNLVFTSKEEVVKMLKDEPSVEPYLY